MQGVFSIIAGLQVIGFALILVFVTHLIGAAFKKLTVIEIWVRRITVVTMIVIGVYLIVKNNSGIYFGF